MRRSSLEQRSWQDAHAAVQLAAPLHDLGLALDSAAAQVFPNDDDRAAAAALLPEAHPLVAIHPGSGSRTKNWPVDRWIALAGQLTRDAHLVVVGGEADEAPLAALRGAFAGQAVSYIASQPLTTVAAVLARCSSFVGHDSGISHIAGAVGTPSVLLFGPTDPNVWAPQNPNVRVVRAADQSLDAITGTDVLRALPSLRLGMTTREEKKRCLAWNATS
jgi:heptosyltransferase-2